MATVCYGGTSNYGYQMALLLHGDYTKWAWLSFSAATPPIYSLAWLHLNL